jgi:hypothetical protein
MLKELHGQRRKFNEETHATRVDCVKAFDKMNPGISWKILNEGIPQHLIPVILCLNGILQERNRDTSLSIYIGHGNQCVMQMARWY